MIYIMEVLCMKKLFWVLSILLIAAVLQGCYSAPPTPSPTPSPTPFTIELKTDKNTYRIGELIVFTIRASRGCYVSLYDTTTTGEVFQIFPNRYATDNLIDGGQVYRIPDTSDAFDFEVTGPPGIERVRVVGTIQNVNVVDQKKVIPTEKFPKINQSADQFDKSVSDKLKSMPEEQWAEASITIQVVK
jgi:hypothetical protein